MHIKLHPLTDPAVISLLEYHTRDMAAHSPEGTSYALDLDALNELGDGSAEIKSMRTAPDFAGCGVGRAMLAYLVSTAKERGYHRLSLETGTTPLFYTAIAFYARAGFMLGEKFSDYVPSRYNIFMHMDLGRPNVHKAVDVWRDQTHPSP